MNNIDLTNVKEAVFERKQYDTNYTVQPLENGNFELYCTHGNWTVQVDKHGRAIDNEHFEDGKQMINRIL